MSAKTAAVAGAITASAFAGVVLLFLLVFWLLESFGVMAVAAAWAVGSFVALWRAVYCFIRAREANLEPTR